ncbi:MAG: GNAT family N-acetyltransferase [Acidobacteria bacterium]|nr:GNAT family N-acetyltransferase [Acidobacteriota bacterium]
MPEDVRLRPVGEEDMEFLRAVYASGREAELAQVPWSEAQRDAFVQMQFTAQLNHYREHSPAAEHGIILADERPVGRLYVERREGEIRILDITLLTAERGRGVGSSLLRALLEEAEETGKSVSIYVENYNPSRRLFERLGFRVIEDDGLNLLLERPPAPHV